VLGVQRCWGFRVRVPRGSGASICRAAERPRRAGWARGSPGFSGGQCALGKRGRRGKDGALAGGDSRSEREGEGALGLGTGENWAGRGPRGEEEEERGGMGCHGGKGPAQGEEEKESRQGCCWASSSSLFPFPFLFLFLISKLKSI
jgi:hypothetical protein